MDRIKRHFKNLPSQEQVATLMLKLGMSVHDGGAYCGPVLQSDTAVARAIDVDRRVVRSTINHIMEVPELLNLFSRVESMLLLANAASEIGCSAIEIVPADAQVPGLMARILVVLSDAGINVRQAVVSDPQDLSDSHLIIVADGSIAGDIMTQIRGCPGVASVIIR